MVPLLAFIAFTTQAKEVINSPSPDGKWVLRTDREKDECAIVEKKSGKVLCKLETPGGEDGRLVWSADSQRAAYLRPWHRGQDVIVYFRKDGAFEEVKLPEDAPRAQLAERRFRNGDPKNSESWHYLKAKRWLKSGALELESSGESELGEKAAVTFAVEFDKQNQAHVGKTQGTLSHHVNLGSVKEMDGDHDAAIAEYSRALELAPKSKDALSGRAEAEMAKGDFKAALKDFTAAENFWGRADVRMLTGGFDAALEDYTRCVVDNLKSKKEDRSDLGFLYQDRGGAYLAKHDAAAALKDFREAVKENGGGHAGVLVWLARVKNGEKEAADQELTAGLAKIKESAESWHEKLIGFLLGSVTEAELTGAAEASESQQNPECEAWFYAGIKRGLSGDKKGAAECFKKAMEADHKVGHAHRIAPEDKLAVWELKALENVK
jgi:tetratricopeptide (TPR) repeat protein